MRSLIQTGSIVLLCAAACAPRVKPPDAQPGEARTVNVGAFVQLDGGKSTDPQGRPLTFKWTLAAVPLGSQAALRDAQTQKPSFYADVPGDYVAQLVVSNGVVASDPRTVTVSVSGCGANAPTIDQLFTTAERPSIGSTVQLGAHVSSADNTTACGSLNETFSWRWSLTQLPAGSQAALNAATSENPSLRADKDGDYVVQLVVTASNGRSSAPAQYTVHVSDCGAAIGATASVGLSAATLGAGPLSVPPLTAVLLGATPADADAACSLPAAGVTWLWQVTSRPAGSSAVLSNRASATAGFTPDVAGTYEFSVQATDTLSGAASPAAFVSLVALPCDSIAPSANRIDVLSGGLLGVATRTGVNAITDLNCLANPTGVVDPSAYRYAWRLGTAPAGSNAVLDNPAAQTPSFTPDLPGSYQLQVAVTNSRGFTSPPVFVTLAVQPCGTAALVWGPQAITRAVVDPQPVAGDSQVHAGDSITLTANAIDPNSCAAGSTYPLTLSYRWSLFSVPVGSKAALSTNSGGSTVFVADVPGTYQYGVVATDSLGNSSPVAYDSVTTSTCGENPVVIAVSPGSSAAAPLGINTFAEQQLSEALPLGVETNDNQHNPAAPGYCPARFQQSIAYAWSIAGGPASGGALSDTAATSTRFSAKAPGLYDVQLAVTAGNGQSARAQGYVRVSTCGSTAPAITSTSTTVGGAPTSRPPVGSQVTLAANGVSPDTLNLSCGGFSTTLTYQWTLVSAPAGSSAAGSGAGASASFQFTADLAGTYVFSVTAKDANGLSSAPTTITVPTGACGPTLPAGVSFSTAFDGDGSATVGNLLSLIAPASGAISDACVASATYTYAWSLTSRPGISATALSAVAGPATSLVPDAPGAYVATLTVTDSGGFSTQLSQTFNVGACASGPTPSAGYSSPAGANAVVYLGDQVSLSPGSVVAGSCNHLTSQAYAYSWAIVSKPSGSAAQLSSATVASPFIVPDVAGGNYTLALTVRDGLGNTGAGSVTVAVSPCGGRAPTVNALTARDGKTSAAIAVSAAGAGYSLSQPTWDPIVLTASASSLDNNAANCPAKFQTTLSYAWQVVSAPVGAQYSLGSATTATPTFAPAAKGAYQLQLVVTDGHGNKSAPLLVAVNILCGDAVPRAADSGPTAAFLATQTLHNITQKRASGVTTGDLSVTASTLQAVTPVAFYPGLPITFAANVQDADTTCGFPQTVSYTWAFTSTPPGSQVAFDSAISATPSFVPDKPGDYSVQLTLKDSKGAQGVQVFPASGAAIVHVGNCGIQTPVALIGVEDPISAAPTATVAASNGFAVVMDGTSSYTLDNAPVDFTATSGVLGCGYNKALSYQWSFVSMPAGASVVFNDPTRVNPAFMPQVSGSYALSLTASDGVRTSLPATVEVITSDAVTNVLDFYAPASSTPVVIQTGHQRFNTFRIEPGATVYLASGVNGGLLDLVVSGDVYIGGTLNLSGSAGMPGPNGDVSWQGSGGGDTAYPLSNHGTPLPSMGCTGTGSQIAITQAVGGSGSAGATGAAAGGSCPAGAGGAYGGGGGGGPSGGGGGGYGGGGGGGGNVCAGNSAGGSGGGTFGGAGGGIAAGGFGGNGGGAPYDGKQGGSNVYGDCSNSGYGGGGGGGSIGLDAANDLAMTSTLRAGSAGGGGAGDEGRGGGGGGGAIRIVSTGGNITVTGQILANGGAGGDSGGDPNCCQGGSGGGGSGGAIWLQATTGVVYNAGTISAAAGRGGVGQSTRGSGAVQNGGAGGLGRIKLVAPRVSNYGILQPALPPSGTNARGYAYVAAP